MNAKESPYNFIYFVLNDTRENLYSRINQRVDIMIKNGLLDEVKRLRACGLNTSHTSMQAIGYKEILEYTNGFVSFEDAVENLKKDTRHLAKRQLTWFRNQKEITWINKPDFDYDENKMLEYIMEEINEKLI
jgi:tRNA dimethylallyltransferase